ncbi:KH domain-containing, RNA-binding, signal transduction-associated protein 2-like isoform X2 [Cimex lectularius]|nr:KH domain-containing, RNA-binding, signal transduction-associated protein 2-like isoform X2 [Cimex lectularius]
MTEMDVVPASEEVPVQFGQSSRQQHQKSMYNGSNDMRNNTREERRRMVDITKDKPIKVSIRVVVPVKDHPVFNFVGKLLGPRGNSLKRLQEETMTKMAILGRGSMKDSQKEEELRGSGDPKFSHLLDELHVEVTAFAPPAEAHARIAYALAEIRRFLVPDMNDDIRQEQMWEMAHMKNGGPPTAQEEPPGPGTGVEERGESPARNGRKRPLLALAQMSPTKRTVLSILARAAQNQGALRSIHPRPFVVPTLRGDLMTGNIIIN